MRVVATVLMFLALAAPASAATCGNTAAGFKTWLAEFKKEMRAEGISKRTISSSLNGLTYYTKVIRLDRGQKSFKQDFEKFYKRRTQGMAPMARKRMKKYKNTFARIEKVYGVPKEMLVTIWGLETGFGHFMGNKSIMRSLATLAYDCRRTEFFTAELIAAIKIVERGDLKPSEMKGAWAGEIGHTQFLATRYMDYAVSFDGDKKRDLYGSVPDALASTAAWFKGNGWQRGGSWEPGSHNYSVLEKWNRATVYQKTIARMATSLVRR